jgi:predicted SAM-dependent methyltransferase
MGKSEKTRLDLYMDLDSPWPFRPDFFEIVYASHVLEHLKDPMRCLQQCHHVLVPGGVCRIAVPYAPWYLGMYQKKKFSIDEAIDQLRSYEPGEHRNPWDIRKLGHYMREAGFEDVRQRPPGESKSPLMRARYFSTRKNRTLFMEGVKDAEERATISRLQDDS